MMKRLGLAIAFCLSLTGGALAQGGMGPGPGTVHSVASYQGPGDVVGSATAWGSCARTYNAAVAAATSMCDLVAVTGGGAVCTLRSAASGFVDLTAYCPGSLTPAAACAAASGGSCVITKVYDQVSTNHWTQATLANMPAITFGALNGLPVINCGTGSNFSLATTATFTSTNFSQSTVYIRSTGTAAGGTFGSASGGFIGAGSIANNAQIQNGTTVNVAGAADLAWHGLNGTFSSVASSDALNVDGVDSPGLAANTSGMSAQALRFCRASATQLAGSVAEGGFWSSTSFNATQRGNLYTNMHGASGYGGVF